MLYIKDNVVRDSSRIVVVKDGYQIINPTAEMITADGWTAYMAPEPEPILHIETARDQLESLITEQYNARTDISDADALRRPLLVYEWDSYIGKSLKTGQIVSYDDRLWRVRQDIASVLGNHYPSTATAALYEVIEVQAAGTKDDPIPYDKNMTIYSGKYYTEDNVLYLCIRDSGQPLYHALKDLVGNYVNKAE